MGSTLALKPREDFTRSQYWGTNSFRKGLMSSNTIQKRSFLVKYLLQLDYGWLFVFVDPHENVHGLQIYTYANYLVLMYISS